MRAVMISQSEYQLSINLSGSCLPVLSSDYALFLFLIFLFTALHEIRVLKLTVDLSACTKLVILIHDLLFLRIEIKTIVRHQVEPSDLNLI